MKQSDEFDKLVKELCEEHNVSHDMFLDMLNEERRVRHLQRRRGIGDRLRAMMSNSISEVDTDPSGGTDS